jgi:hypothetical protein
MMGKLVHTEPAAVALQAWEADYDYVATGEITQDGNGTLSYDLSTGNGKTRSSKSCSADREREREHTDRERLRAPRARELAPSRADTRPCGMTREQ